MKSAAASSTRDRDAGATILRRHATPLALLATLALLLLVPPAAQAAPKTIAGLGSAAAQVEGPIGTAVDQSTGDLYVADSQNGRIDKFDSEGNFLLAWGFGVADGKSAKPQTCGSEATPPTIRCFGPLFNNPPNNEAGNIQPTAVAVDQSSGDVYVADSTRHRVTKFTPDGELIFMTGPDVTFSGPGNTGANEHQTLTVKATSGTYTLALTAPVEAAAQGSKAETTTAIPYDATAAEVQAALEALPSVEAGGVTVTGGPGDPTGSSPYSLTFTAPPYQGNYLAPIGTAGSQAISVEGASGGTFKLSFKGESTAAIPYNASAAGVQGALEALKTIGAGNVSLTGPAAGPWTLSFTGSLAATQPTIGAGSTALAPATAKLSVAAIATTAIAVPGGGPEVCEPSRGDVCKASSPGEYFGSLGGLTVDASGNPWALDGSRIDELDSSGSLLSQVPISGVTGTRGLARDSAGNFYTIKPGANEEQSISFSGFAKGDSFRLDNLPGLCAASSTAPITSEAPAAVEEALNEACGGGKDFQVFSLSGVYFVGKLAAQNFGQLTCTKLSGAGSCSATTIRDGVPGSVKELEPSGALLKTLYSGGPEALALDAAGDLYVGDKRNYHFLEFDPAGALRNSFGAGQVITANFGEGNEGPAGNALAVDEASGVLYAASSLTGEASAVQRFDLPAPGPLPEEPHAEGVLPTSAALAATLNPEGHETSYRFQYLPQATYDEQGDSFEGAEETTEATLTGTEFEAEGVSAAIAHLIPATEYRFRILAENEDGETEAQASFTTRPAVAIEAQWASEVAARSATLNARLDPLGVTAKWWIEYGTSPCEEGGCAETAKAPLPGSFGQIPVATAFTGLQPATAYHYRFVASDERDGVKYTVKGREATFTTQLAGLEFTLPDERAWEMVSPPDKHGGSIKLGYGEGQIQAAANGEAVSYLSSGSIEAAPEGSRAPERSSVLSRRGIGGDWGSQDIMTNGGFSPLAVGAGFEYKLFDSDLGRALIEPRSTTPLSPDASERTPYLRENAEPPTYTPLLSGCPAPPEPCPPAVEENADVPAGTEFGFPPGSDPRKNPSGAVEVEGASPDLAHIALRSAVPLVAGAADGGLYEWTAASPPTQRLRPVSIKPGGGAATAAELGSGHASIRGAIAVTGSRVFWSAMSGTVPSGLYLRDTGREETLRIDSVQPGAFGTGAVGPVFQGANSEGTVAFFTDTQNLTADANENGADLYRCAVVVEAGQLKCDLTDLTAQTENPADPFEATEVQGLAAGISENGARLYFVARGVLASNAGVALDPETHEPEKATPGEPNLYLWQQGQGTRFIATLSAKADYHDWGSGEAGSNIFFASFQAASPSPSGRYLAFMSALPLTDYDNRDAASGEADQEVFRYDAEAKDGEGELICASCNPSGVRPTGLRAQVGRGGTPGGAAFYDFQELWTEGESLAAILPDATRLGQAGVSLYRPRAVQDDGRLFFNAADALVSADSNGTWDVYQYEPLRSEEGAPSTDTCSASSGDAATALVAGGCVSLISSGTGEEEAGFLDASEGGDDVFFFTPAQLSVTDEDKVTDVYDARVDGVPAALSPSAECLGEACQPPASPPPAQTPASAAFQGPGNASEAPKARCPKAKSKVKQKGKARCVKSKHKRANHNRRAGR